MNDNPSKAYKDDFIKGVEAALRRSALVARKTAARTNTPLVIFKDGKIVKQIITGAI